MQLPFSETLIIIPTYNEILNIEKMITTLFELYNEISILIVDDGSPDGTSNIVKTLMKDNKNLSMIERHGKLGLGTAYIAGFRWALERNYKYIFEMDGDFSHDPKQISDLLEAAQTYNLVIGSRYIKGVRIINWPIQRLLLSYFASVYSRVATGMPIYDSTSGFKCFNRYALESLNLNNINSNGYGFQIEVNYKIFSKGLSIKEIPIIFYERTDGQSKMGKGIIIEAFFKVLFLRLKNIIGSQ